MAVILRLFGRGSPSQPPAQPQQAPSAHQAVAVRDEIVPAAQPPQQPKAPICDWKSLLKKNTDFPTRVIHGRRKHFARSAAVNFMSQQRTISSSLLEELVMRCQSQIGDFHPKSVLKGKVEPGSIGETIHAIAKAMVDSTKGQEREKRIVNLETIIREDIYSRDLNDQARVFVDVALRSVLGELLANESNKENNEFATEYAEDYVKYLNSKSPLYNNNQQASIKHLREVAEDQYKTLMTFINADDQYTFYKSPDLMTILVDDAFKNVCDILVDKTSIKLTLSNYEIVEKQLFNRDIGTVESTDDLIYQLLWNQQLTVIKRFICGQLVHMLDEKKVSESVSFLNESLALCKSFFAEPRNLTISGTEIYTQSFQNFIDSHNYSDTLDTVGSLLTRMKAKMKLSDDSFKRLATPFTNATVKHLMTQAPNEKIWHEKVAFFREKIAQLEIDQKIKDFILESLAQKTVLEKAYSIAHQSYSAKYVITQQPIDVCQAYEQHFSMPGKCILREVLQRVIAPQDFNGDFVTYSNEQIQTAEFSLTMTRQIPGGKVHLAQNKVNTLKWVKAVFESNEPYKVALPAAAQPDYSSYPVIEEVEPSPAASAAAPAPIAKPSDEILMDDFELIEEVKPHEPAATQQPVNSAAAAAVMAQPVVIPAAPKVKKSWSDQYVGGKRIEEIEERFRYFICKHLVNASKSTAEEELDKRLIENMNGEYMKRTQYLIDQIGIFEKVHAGEALRLVKLFYARLPKKDEACKQIKVSPFKDNAQFLQFVYENAVLDDVKIEAWDKKWAENHFFEEKYVEYAIHALERMHAEGSFVNGALV